MKSEHSSLDLHKPSVDILLDDFISLMVAYKSAINDSRIGETGLEASYATLCSTVSSRLELTLTFKELENLFYHVKQATLEQTEIKTYNNFIDIKDRLQRMNPNIFKRNPVTMEPELVDTEDLEILL